MLRHGRFWLIQDTKTDLLDPALSEGSAKISFTARLKKLTDQYRKDITGTDWACFADLRLCADELKMKLAVYEPAHSLDGFSYVRLVYTHVPEDSTSQTPWAHVYFSNDHFESTNIPHDFEPLICLGESLYCHSRV